MATQNDDRDVVVIREGDTGVRWFLLGALLGAGAALLLAPASGEETRRRLSRQARRVRARTEDLMDEFGERVRTGASRVRDEVEDRVEDLRSDIGEFGDAVRGAGASAREELERRLADARSRRRSRVEVADEDDEESLA
ncbi:MAG TPA: YtxH domain-containing protein [Gemmatimonadales bacterium]|nr:YtxH domain-containing protein [Gemmatimonadales bacterium]